ncbi:hypothetical protein [Streptococcus sp. LYSM12]|uniref:hypothetical protein n=1 Tax=unclassified Streptococcus TaxID=2608887 RepID=UPI001430A889|nr:hypothetical protein [Streptococcus sp. LYSM12]
MIKPLKIGNKTSVNHSHILCKVMLFEGGVYHIGAQAATLLYSSLGLLVPILSFTYRTSHYPPKINHTDTKKVLSNLPIGLL